MILIINVCHERMHYLEFVKPVEDLAGKSVVKQYRDIRESDLEGCNKVIICGTSLLDGRFLEDIGKFEWIKGYDKPILGICAGMQIISLVFGGRLKSKKEIGYYSETFRPFLGLKGKEEVYHLHRHYATVPDSFTEYAKSDIPQAIKHDKKEIYGVLFHPEVRNRELLLNFIRL